MVMLLYTGAVYQRTDYHKNTRNAPSITVTFVTKRPEKKFTERR